MQKRFGVKPPFLILGGHVSLLDCFFVSLCVRGAVYFVASDDIFATPLLSRLMKFLVSPIAKNKGASDLQTVKDCLEISKQGGNVGIFASGNTSYSGEEACVGSQISRLAKIMKCDILIFKTHGLYGVDPRWANHIRKGKCKGEIVSVINKAEAEILTNDELQKKIVDGISFPHHCDEVLSNYKSSLRAEYLERFLFACPSCKSLNTLVSQGKLLECNSCGMIVEYGERLNLILIKGKKCFKTLKEWHKFQISLIEELLTKTVVGKIFCDENEKLVLNQRAKRKTILIKNATLSLFEDKIVVGNSLKKEEFMLDDIFQMAIQGRNKLIFYINGQNFQIKGNKRTNHLKYMAYFYLRKKKKGVDIGGVLEL